MRNYRRPDARGHFAGFGGRYVPETLIPALNELQRAYAAAKRDRQGFRQELHRYLTSYAGRPTPLYRARRLEQDLGGVHVYLKREDLAHTGSHKINNTLGQVLLARRMGKKRIVAETGAGQHGVATATAAALLGLPCRVYMGSEDIRRQRLNVFRMELLGAEVTPVDVGNGTLKEAINEAIRDWVTNVRSTHYVLGSVVGPHPYPMMVRDFQSVIGRETRRQIRREEGRLPDAIIACVGGGSNAMGIFYPFLDDPVELIGVEAGGVGMETGAHGATLVRGRPGVLHGTRSYLLQDEEGQVSGTHSVAAGLDYPGVGPEHAYLKDTGRARYLAVSDTEAIDGFTLLARKEGIIPALESAHAVAYACHWAREQARDTVIVVNLSGRGDKDAEEVGRLRNPSAAQKNSKETP